MSGTITRIGATGAGALLALGLFAAPPAGAAGAGKDASRARNSETTGCFTATGHTQGRSHSDPDGMSNGGADKPGCPGGVDADRDGNNGCGNDTDREDDNNGRCGGRKAPRVRDQRSTPPEVKADKHEKRADATVSMAGAGSAVALSTIAPAVPGTDVAAAGATTPDTLVPDTLVPDMSVPDTLVLGETLTRPSALARTGAGVGGLALLGGLLCGAGRLTLLARRVLRIG